MIFRDFGKENLLTVRIPSTLDSMDNDDMMEPPPSTLVPIYGPDIVERARYFAGDDQSLDRIWHICVWLRDWERMKMRIVPGYAEEHWNDEYL